jgi:LCP family protein required for cell wall assembly
VNEWPSEWFRDGERGGPRGDSGAPQQAGTPGSADPTVSVSAGNRGGGGGAGGRAGRAGNPAWPQQPPTRSARPEQAQWQRPAPVAGRSGGGSRPRSRLRLAIAIVAVVVAVVLVVSVVGYFYLDSRLNRKNVLVDYSGRPAAGAGTNWLITGSDSRQGLTRKQERQLATGLDIGGHRSDTVLVLHIPSNGNPSVLVSIPRDSYVQIPGYGFNKINAAYSLGGPRLLAQTVQNATGLRIDHYMGIGFGGLVNVVNAIGGVHMCLPRPITDPAAGLHLKKGCQTLDGAQALGFVRTRHSFASQDLQREQNQRVFIKALLSKLTSAGTLLNPFAVVPAAFGSTSALTVDEGTHLYQLISVAFALRQPQTTTVPIGNANYPTSNGDAVLWDKAQATQLFDDLNSDHKVPKSLLTGSRLQG